MYHGKTRPDLNEGCPERLDWDFVKWVWNFRRTRRPGILEKLKEHGKDKKIIIFKSISQVWVCLRAVKEKGAGYFEEQPMG